MYYTAPAVYRTHLLLAGAVGGVGVAVPFPPPPPPPWLTLCMELVALADSPSASVTSSWAGGDMGGELTNQTPIQLAKYYELRRLHQLAEVCVQHVFTHYVVMYSGVS